MRKVYLMGNGRPHFGLQMFAEGNGGGPDGGDSGGSGGGENGSGSPGGGNEGGSSKGESGAGNQDDGNGPVSFDEYLKLEGNQAEFDRRVQKAINTAVANAKEKWEALTDERLSEAEKLAKMTKEERAAYLAKKDREEFEAEKAAFEKEKLLLEVKGVLQEQSLPTAFADSLVEAGDAEKIRETIAKLKKAWDEGIQEAVKGKARQTTPGEGSYLPGKDAGMSSLAKMAKEARIIKN